MKFHEISTYCTPWPGGGGDVACSPRASADLRCRRITRRKKLSRETKFHSAQKYFSRAKYFRVGNVIFRPWLQTIEILSEFNGSGGPNRENPEFH